MKNKTLPEPPRSPQVTKVSDLVKYERGFHKATITESNADAMLRHHKTDSVCSASLNVQKGDLIVFEVNEDILHDISEVVWKVTFVSAVPHSEQPDGYGLVTLSLCRLSALTFHKGDFCGKFLEDTITGDL